MRIDKSLLLTTQGLTLGLLVHIKRTDYRLFASETLQVIEHYLRGNGDLDPDDLYERFENLDEEDLSTYADLDGETPESVWQAILTHVALCCFYLYRERGIEYLPQTLEAIDEGTIEDYFSYYRKSLIVLPSLLHEISNLMASDLGRQVIERYACDMIPEG